MTKQKLEFYNIKTGKRFITKKYIVKKVNTPHGYRYVAYTKDNGNLMSRFVSI